MLRTVDPEEARRVVNRGNADFRVVTTETVTPSDASGTRFLIQVPLHVMRDGIFGPLATAVGANGKATKFGNDLFDTLRRLDGVEPSLDHDMPTSVMVFVDSSVHEEPPPAASGTRPTACQPRSATPSRRRLCATVRALAACWSTSAGSSEPRCVALGCDCCTADLR